MIVGIPPTNRKWEYKYKRVWKKKCGKHQQLKLLLAKVLLLSWQWGYPCLTVTARTLMILPAPLEGPLHA